MRSMSRITYCGAITFKYADEPTTEKFIGFLEGIKHMIIIDVQSLKRWKSKMKIPYEKIPDDGSLSRFGKNCRMRHSYDQDKGETKLTF